MQVTKENVKDLYESIEKIYLTKEEVETLNKNNEEFNLLSSSQKEEVLSLRNKKDKRELELNFLSKIGLIFKVLSKTNFCELCFKYDEFQYFLDNFDRIEGLQIEAQRSGSYTKFFLLFKSA